MDRAKTKAGKKEAALMDELLDLASALSPENLHCDGEISRSAAMVKYRKLKAQWKAVEKKLGRKVSEDEVWDYCINKKDVA